MEFKFNIPNNITLIRILLLPVFAFFLLSNIPYEKYVAAFIFIMLSLSDYLDGYFARKKNQITEFGKLMDPIADKLLISLSLILLVGKGVPWWIAMIIIYREILLTVVRIYLIPTNKVIPASYSGKVKTVFQIVAILFVILNFPLAIYFLIIAAILTLVSGFEYLYQIRKMTGKKVVNLANSITLIRLILIGPFAHYLLNGERIIALVLFSIIAIGDKIDGLFSRMGKSTEAGSIFDSFTDWTLMITSLSILIYTKEIQIFWAFVALIPLIVIPFVKIFYARKHKKFPTNTLIKICAGLMYVTVIAILLNFEYSFYLIVTSFVFFYLGMFSYIQIWRN